MWCQLWWCMASLFGRVGALQLCRRAVLTAPRRPVNVFATELGTQRHFLATSCTDHSGGDDSPPTKANQWVVFRTDTHGNRVVIQRLSDEREARQVAAQFEARGHKQAYWVARENGDSVDL